MTENQKDGIVNNRPQFLDVSDLQTMFGVGRSKARLMMDTLPSVRVGSKDYVTHIRTKRLYRRTRRYPSQLAQTPPIEFRPGFLFLRQIARRKPGLSVHDDGTDYP